ncbi:MAG: hypothetical protein KDB80_16475, partial [Planctomycetes bacterium]|nr:hypothetical protein [Planctomycetota bacterium]
MKNLRSIVCVFSLAASVWAQSVPPAADADAFAEARVAAEVENDFALAERIYSTLTTDAVSADDRARAWLCLADVRQRLGKTDEANAALAKAAAGEGPAAQDAKRRQAGAQVSDGRVLERIAQFRNGFVKEADLIWYGPAVVGPLIEWVEQEGVDLEFVTRATKVLLALRNDEVDAWIRGLPETSGPLQRRALLRAVRVMPMGDPPSGFSSVVGSAIHALEPFSTDPDPVVLRDALERIGLVFGRERLLDLTMHEDPDVRAAAWDCLCLWPA